MSRDGIEHRCLLGVCGRGSRCVSAFLSFEDFIQNYCLSGQDLKANFRLVFSILENFLYWIFGIVVFSFCVKNPMSTSLCK